MYLSAYYVYGNVSVPAARRAAIVLTYYIMLCKANFRNAESRKVGKSESVTKHMFMLLKAIVCCSDLPDGQLLTFVLAESDIDTIVIRVFFRILS